MKKQIFATIAIFILTLLVFVLFFYNSSQSVADGSLSLPKATALFSSAALPPQSQEQSLVCNSSQKLYLIGGTSIALGYALDMKIIKIMLVALFTCLFIKSIDPRVEFTFDSDGKK